MKKDIILAGVGGQGILSIATIIGSAAVASGLYVKQAEVHGMSQRGGDVQSNLRISDKPVASDLIALGKADIILSVEPMESLRYLPWLSESGWLITNVTPFVNVPNYPPIDAIMGEVNKVRQHLIIDADQVAKDLGSARVANMVILGAAAPYLGMPIEALEQAIRATFGRKGEEVVELNIKALRTGRDSARS
jgi:indolepyruvate ferredoxin oxidoreductase beta subunit